MALEIARAACDWFIPDWRFKRRVVQVALNRAAIEQAHSLKAQQSEIRPDDHALWRGRLSRCRMGSQREKDEH